MADVRAKVAAIIDSSMVAFNVGSNKGVSSGDLVRLWRIIDIPDPDSKKPLGRINVAKLKLVVNHVQENLCVAYVDDAIESVSGSGIFTGVAVDQWQRRKKVTDDPSAADVNTVLVRIGDAASVTVKDADEGFSDEPPF
jgi:hypothetical protein